MTFERKNKAKRTLLTIVLLAFFSMTSSHALEAPFPTKDKPFAVKDSGVEVPYQYGGPVKWMDNDRVIFTAFRADIPRNEAPEGLHIVIWDITQGTVTHYADGKLRCYSDGQIVYLTEPEVIAPGKTVPKQKSGEMGSEQFVDLRANEVAGLLNPYSCNTYSSLGHKTSEEVYRPDPLMHILRLREDHGYLDLHTKGQQVIEKGPNGRVTIRQVTRLPFVPMNKYHIKYYRAGEKEPIDLNSVKGGISEPVFSKYASAYVLDQLIPNRGSVELSQPNQFPEGPPTVRLLSPEGNVTTLSYPSGLYEMTSATRINISQHGLLIAASAGERFHPKSKTTGLFLVRGNKFVKLVDDVIPEMDVSPNGCKVAFRHGITGVGGWPIPGNLYTVKMINVCDSTHE